MLTCLMTERFLQRVCWVFFGRAEPKNRCKGTINY